MLSKKFLLILILFTLTGCGFHLRQSDLKIDFSKIEPKSERDQFVQISNTMSMIRNDKAKISVSNLKIEPKLISTQNTGNKWRQYEYNAQWTLNDMNGKKHHVTASESLNLPSNQSPYQTQIISDQLNGLRMQLLKNTRSAIFTPGS